MDTLKKLGGIEKTLPNMIKDGLLDSELRHANVYQPS